MILAMIERSSAALRLQTARETAGFRKAADAAQHFRWKKATYYGHENGNRAFNMAAAKKYAKAYRVSWIWLLTGEGEVASGLMQNQHLDTEAVSAAFSSLLITVLPGISPDEASAVVETVIRLLLFPGSNKGSSRDLDRIRRAVHDVAELAFPPKSE